MNKFGKFAVGMIAAGALGTVVFMRINKKEEPMEAVPNPTVQVENPRMDTIVLTTDLTGTVEPSDVVYVISQGAGEVLEVFVKQGDTVAAGQMIAEPAKGLSVGIHASIDGVVKEVSEKYVIIETQEGRAGK